jgi:glutathione S-transferase
MAFDKLETRLSHQRWLVGGRFTEADLRLFPTLVRFDTVYYVLFKCNLRRFGERMDAREELQIVRRDPPQHEASRLQPVCAVRQGHLEESRMLLGL